jgi:hypothetical protein
MFFSFAAEIRLKIYAELLVHSGPIKITADYTFSPTRLRGTKGRLHPQILRVNKLASIEASPLLYSQNRFWFPERRDPACNNWIDQVAPFLACIGPIHAGLIQYIGIEFVGVDDHEDQSPELEPKLRERYKLLQLICDTCPCIRTIHMVLDLSVESAGMAWYITMDILRNYDKHLQAIPSLDDVVVDITADEVIPADELNPDDLDDWDEVDFLAHRMRDEYRWRVNINRPGSGAPQVHASDDGDNSEEEGQYGSYMGQQVAQRIRAEILSEMRSQTNPLSGSDESEEVEGGPVSDETERASLVAEERIHTLLVERMRDEGYELNLQDKTWHASQEWLPWAPIPLYTSI